MNPPVGSPGLGVKIDNLSLTLCYYYLVVFSFALFVASAQSFSKTKPFRLPSNVLRANCGPKTFFAPAPANLQASIY